MLQVLVQAYPVPGLARSMLASVALRTSMGSRRRSSPFSSNRSKAYRNACGSFRLWRRSWKEVWLTAASEWTKLAHQPINGLMGAFTRTYAGRARQFQSPHRPESRASPAPNSGGRKCLLAFGNHPVHHVVADRGPARRRTRHRAQERIARADVERRRSLGLEIPRPLLARTARSAGEAAEVQGLAGLGELFDTLVVFEELDDRARPAVWSLQVFFGLGTIV